MFIFINNKIEKHLIYFHPTEVDFLIVNSDKSIMKLDWKLEYDHQRSVKNVIVAIIFP